MDYSSFSHGQIQSKLWLCQELEKFVKSNSNIVILGSWYNVLGFMMLARNQNYESITGIDCNHISIEISNKICDAWMINEDQKIRNEHKDVNEVSFTSYDTIICTSVEDIESEFWYEKVPKEKLICLQAINLDPDQARKYPDWVIKNPIPSLVDFKKKFPMSQTLFEGQKEFDYGDLKYTRYMLIGIK